MQNPEAVPVHHLAYCNTNLYVSKTVFVTQGNM